MQPLCLCVRVCMGAHVCVHVCVWEREREQTLLLSSMSALLPTNILFTLSEACCSMLRIQFRMSEQGEWVNHKEWENGKDPSVINKAPSKQRKILIPSVGLGIAFCETSYTCIKFKRKESKLFQKSNKVES